VGKRQVKRTSTENKRTGGKGSVFKPRLRSWNVQFAPETASDYKEITFSITPFICVFFASSSLFFFPSTLAPYHERIALYSTSLTDERNDNSLLPIYALP
jgi:hypothetical protein